VPIVTLPLVLAVVLLELAIGGAFVLWALDRTKQAPAGYLKLMAGVDAAVAGLVFLLLPTLPRGGTAELAALDPAPLESFAVVVPIVAVLFVAHLVTTFIPFRPLRAVIGALVLVAGGGALVAAAVARPADPANAYDIFALLALPLGALALGGTNGAMLLGHWYLVTPKLSPAPLQRAALIVAGAILLQAVVVAVAFARGQLVGAMESTLVVAIAIRVGVGVLMTFGLVLAAWWTARMNTQSSTGLLYVALGTALAGELAARVVYYLTGTAV